MPHADHDSQALLELATRLAREAGTAALTGRRNLAIGQPPAHDTKSSATDPVTEFDRAAEAHIVAELQRVRPHDAIVGEEGANQSGTSGIAWHIDPIDGTANFLYDLPAWCTSVAAVSTDGTASSTGSVNAAVAGAVYLPVTDEMFAARRGAGATLNGERIAASTVTDVSMALTGTGFSYVADRRRGQADLVRQLLPVVRDIRRSGSAAIDLVSVAAGRLDAYYEQYLNSWDMAAGLLIATEAGARASSFDGGPASESSLVTSAAGVHDQLLTTLAEASAALA